MKERVLHREQVLDVGIEEWDPPRRFVDQQLRGPYALWHHTHSFEEIDPTHTRMTDRVRYADRFGLLGTIGEHLVVKRDLRRIFDHRRDSIAALIGENGSDERHA